MEKIIIFLLLVFSCTFLSAQENYDDLFKDLSTDVNKEIKNNQTDSNIGFELCLSGTHTFGFYMPADPDYFNFKGYIKSPKFLNDIGIDICFKGLKLVSHWELDAILNELYGKNNINEIDYNKVLRIIPLENKIEYSFWKMKISAGYQKFCWGVADKLNPTDNINPRDYRDVKISASAKKLSTLSAYLGIYPVNFISIETVYVPFGEKTYFPVDVAEEVSDELVRKGNPADVEIIYKDFDPKNFKLGGKVNFYFSNADFSFSYLYDIDPYFTPVIEMEEVDLSFLPGGKVNNFYKIRSVDLVQKRIHQFGFDIKTVIKKVGLWAEFCYSMSENYDMTRFDIRKHKFSWVAGVDFNYGPNNDFYFNIQYIGEVYPFFDDRFYKDYSDTTIPIVCKTIPFHSGQSKSYYEEYYYRSLTNKVGNYYEGLYQGISCKMEWPVINSLLKPSVITGYFIPLIYNYDEEIKYGTLLLNPEIDLMPLDSFHIILGADLFYSWHKLKDKGVELDRDYKYGRYTESNNIYLEIKYSWNFLLKK